MAAGRLDVKNRATINTADSGDLNASRVALSRLNDDEKCVNNVYTRHSALAQNTVVNGDAPSPPVLLGFRSHIDL